MQPWQDFLSRMDRELGKYTTDKWLRSLTIQTFDAGNLYLEAADTFQIVWFEEHVRPKLRSMFSSGSGKKIKVHLGLKNEGRRKGVDKRSHSENEGGFFSPDVIEAHCQFSGFVPGGKNALTFQVFAQLVGYKQQTNTFDHPTQPLGEFNPIFVYGPPGVGKTHITMATANALKNQGYTVHYVKSETFTEHVIGAYRNSMVQQFRGAYRKADVLIIDDIHLLAKKNTTQEELFHTFNALHTAGKQIIVTSLYAPRKLQNIEERLISRFEWGITLPLEKLSAEERKEIVEKRCEMLQFPLKQELLDYLVQTFSNHKSLTRAIEALVLRSHVDGRLSDQLSKDDGKRLLQDLLDEEKRCALTPERLLAIVAKAFRVPPEDVLGKSKAKEFVLPRQVAMYLCRTELKLSYLKIASIFSRDHSTVMASVRSVTKALQRQDVRITHPFADIHQKVASI